MSGSNSYKLGIKEYKHASKTVVLLLLKNESKVPLPAVGEAEV